MGDDDLRKAPHALLILNVTKMKRRERKEQREEEREEAEKEERKAAKREGSPTLMTPE